MPEQRKLSSNGICCHATLPDLLYVMAHGVRIEILVSLTQSPKDVSSLAAELDLEPQKISHHLRPLYGCGLVEFERVKKRHVYRLSQRLTSAVRDSTLCLDMESSEGLGLKLEFPVNKAIRWDPPEASLGLHLLPSRLGG